MEPFAVLFDMDGLMLDTERMARIAWMRALQETGYCIGEKDYLRLVGRTVSDARTTLKELFGPGIPFDAIFSRCQRYYDEDIRKNGILLKPGLQELLSYLEGNQIPKAVASSTAQKIVLYKLNLVKLDRRFQAIVGGDMVRHGKPAPDLFQLAAKQINFEPKNCVVLEDSEAGICAAYSAGMLPVMIPDLKQPTPEIWQKAWCVLPTLREAIPLFTEFIANGLPARKHNIVS